MLRLILLVLAVAAFVLVTIGVNGGRINFTGLGLALFAAAFAVPG